MYLAIYIDAAHFPHGNLTHFMEPVVQIGPIFCDYFEHLEHTNAKSISLLSKFTFAESQPLFCVFNFSLSNFISTVIEFLSIFTSLKHR